jgi:hypothetical protein
MGISMFLGQPVDSSMQPMSIMAAQPKPQQPPQMQGSASKKPSGTAGTAMRKGANAFKTQGQEAESDRSSRE